MIQVIPNWHPMIVHYAIALLSMAVGVFIVARFVTKEALQYQLRIFSRIALYIGLCFGGLAIATGFHAYYTVNHDTSAHAQMILHKNWALGCVSLFSIVVIWLMISWRKKILEKKSVIALMLISSFALATTTWSGGELVFRHGLGVLALPDTDGHAHAGGESDGHVHDESSLSPFNIGVNVLPKESHDQLHQHGIDHDHEKSPKPTTEHDSLESMPHPLDE